MRTHQEALTGWGRTAPSSATVVDIAVSSADHTILVQAVTEAGLVETLSGDGPFTVLAPTDEAFAAALEALGLTAEELLASEDLADILTYHVLPTSALAADVIGLDGQMVETVNGDTVEITVTDEGGVMIDGAAGSLPRKSKLSCFCTCSSAKAWKRQPGNCSRKAA